MSRALAVLATLAMSCAHDMHVKMPKTEDGAMVGTIEVLFTREADDVTVVVDRKLVARDGHTERIVISNVPTGVVELMVAAGSGPGRVERFMRVEIEPDTTTTVPIAAPDKSMMSDLPSSLIMILVGVALRVLYLELF